MFDVCLFYFRSAAVISNWEHISGGFEISCYTRSELAFIGIDRARACVRARIATLREFLYLSPLRFLKNYVRPNFPLNRCLARWHVRSTYVDQMAHFRERNDSQAFQILDASPCRRCRAARRFYPSRSEKCTETLIRLSYVNDFLNAHMG